MDGRDGMKERVVEKGRGNLPGGKKYTKFEVSHKPLLYRKIIDF